MSLRDTFKRKMPATFNAAEYETGRVLDRLEELSKQVKYMEILNGLEELSKQAKDTEILNGLEELSKQAKDTEILNGLDKLSKQFKDEDILKLLNQILEQLRQTTGRVEALEKQNYWLKDQITRNRNNEILLTPKPVLRVELHVAESCNLNCRGCTHFSCIAKPEFLEPDILERDMKRLAELYDNGAQQIKLLGGEPLLNPKLPELCRVVRRYFPDTHLVILTNGTLLPEMENEFWVTCREMKVELACTEYPIEFDYRKAEELVRQQGIPYTRHNLGEKTLWHMPLDITGKQDPVRSFKNCNHPNDMCISLYHGRLYTCAIAANARHFEERFHVGIKMSPRDCIDIHEVTGVWEIMEFLTRPIPFCRYCNVGKRTYNHKYGKSNGSINEWTLPCPKEDQ